MHSKQLRAPSATGPSRTPGGSDGGGAGLVALTEPLPPDSFIRLLGEHVDAVHRLPAGGHLLIGSAEAAALRIDDPSIGARHAVLHVGERLELEDLGSPNGTRVAGRRLAAGERVELAAGGVAELGRMLLYVQDAARRDRAVEPAAQPAVATATATATAPTMARVRHLIERAAPTDVSILLLGETGVGKEVTASAIHASSPRRGRTLLRLNCAAIPEPLLEAELFGHERGAFTGALQPKPGLLETADGGTVFLDEIGELSLGIQAKLLRVIEQRQVFRLSGLRPRDIDVRFIAATNRDLREEMARGRFRRDLFYRLEGVTIGIPPLRARLDELDSLADQFLTGASVAAGRTLTLAPEARALLHTHRWPGNIRELRNVIERAAILCSGDVITCADLPLDGGSDAVEDQGHPAPAPAADVGLDATSEHARVLEALERCGGNQTRAAKLLGISRGTFISRLAAYRVRRPRLRL